MTKNIRWMLVFYDMGVYAIAALLLLAFYAGDDKLSGKGIFEQAAISIVCIFAARIIGNIYGQVWRYGGIQCYIRLLFTDFAGFLAYLCLESILPIQHITFGRLLSLVSLNLLGALAIRMVYRYAYKCGNHDTVKGKILLALFRIFSGMEIGNDNDIQKIKVAIIGAGRVGVGLAEELLNNSEASYTPRCFIDVNKEKVGREIHGIPVWSEEEATLRKLEELEVQEIVFAIPSMDAEKKKELYDYYKKAGYKLKVYDFPMVYAVGGKRHLRVFETYHPQIVINAAAHKHVPLMEHNCIEAIENNIFGTEVVVNLCEEYGAERFMMVSTDKAVNPTNVMGATKRMCEMIVQSASTHGKVKYSITRFGNVLGSAGSVIPLFKRQIANGGPVTITDKRIIRYFMTIPEASQLVLQSGAIANNGELFVLDMGKPVKIMDLAENMIRLSGVHGVEIVETGLRPGEKLYEELLVKTEELDKTSNSMIFIERDKALSADEIDKRIGKLKKACETGDDLEAKEVLRKVVPTFKTPEEVNKKVKNK